MKLLRVFGDDYSSMMFEQQFSGYLAKDIIAMVENDIDIIIRDEDSEVYACTFEVHDVGTVSDKFISYVRNIIQDYDMSKSDNFYFENQTI